MSIQDIVHATPFAGPSSIHVTALGIELWFSYQTCIAYRLPGSPLPVVRVNDWSKTTGKHLNAIDGGGPRQKDRIPGDAFEQALALLAGDVCELLEVQS